MVWKKEDQLLWVGTTKVARDERIRLTDTSIEIVNVRPGDSGDYSCSLNTEQKMNLTVTLDILEPAKVRRFPEDGRVLARKGESLKLECLGEGNPTPIITWSRSQGRLLPNEVETETGPILNFNSVGRQEAGRYQCTASNGVGQPAILTFDLHVLYPPEIEIERSWIHTGVGQEANLICNVHAEPSANVLWYRDDRVIVPSENRLLESSGNKHTLMLHYVEEADFGLYSCTAENNLGRSSQNIELSGRPSRAIFKSEPMGLSADAFNLTWRIDSYAPIEEYRLMFRKLQYNDSDDVVREWSSIIIPGSSQQMHSGSGSSLKHHKQWFLLEDLETGSVYEATVTAKNRYGTSELSEAFQFYTLGLENVPNVKNLEAKDVAGYEIGAINSHGIRPHATVTLCLLAVAVTLLLKTTSNL